MTIGDGLQTSINNFTVSFERGTDSDSIIDANDLAMALLGLSAAFEQANVVLNGDSAEVRLNARATSPGSFEIDLQLVQVITTNAMLLLASSPVVSVLNLRNILIAADGVIGTVKRLGGNRPTITTLPDGESEFRANGDTFVVNAQTVQIFNNSDVRQPLQQFVGPLGGEIDKISFRENDAEIIGIEKEEAQYFTFEGNGAQDEPDRSIEVQTSIARESLSLVVPRFKPDPLFNRWRLQLGKHNPSTYLITDQEFLAKVDRGTKFGKGDILTCDVRVTDTIDRDTTKSEYEILKVVEHQDGPVQLALLDEEEPDSDLDSHSEAGDSD